MCSPILKGAFPCSSILNQKKKSKTKQTNQTYVGEEKLGELHWPFIFGKYPNGVSAPCLRKGCVTAIFLIMWEATSKKAAVWFHPSGNLSICESLQDSWISKLHGRGQPGLLFYLDLRECFTFTSGILKCFTNHLTIVT